MRPCRSYIGGKGLVDRLGKCLFTKRLCDMLSAARSVFWVKRAEGSIGLPAEEAALIRPGHQSVFPLADTLQTPWANTGLPLALCLSLRQPQVKSTLELTLSFSLFHTSLHCPALVFVLIFCSQLFVTFFGSFCLCCTLFSSIFCLYHSHPYKSSFSVSSTLHKVYAVCSKQSACAWGETSQKRPL